MVIDSFVAVPLAKAGEDIYLPCLSSWQGRVVEVSINLLMLPYILLLLFMFGVWVANEVSIDCCREP